MIHAELAAEIKASAMEIFSSMIMMDIKEITMEKYQLEKAESNISSMLGMGGEIKGSLDLHFPEKVAVTITSQFLGMDILELDEDVRDAIGELANMVGGDLKTYFASKDIKTEIAIPNTVVGKSYRTHGLAGAEKVNVAFSCGAGNFLAELKYVLKK